MERRGRAKSRFCFCVRRGGSHPVPCRIAPSLAPAVGSSVERVRVGGMEGVRVYRTDERRRALSSWETIAERGLLTRASLNPERLSKGEPLPPAAVLTSRHWPYDLLNRVPSGVILSSRSMLALRSSSVIAASAGWSPWSWSPPHQRRSFQFCDFSRAIHFSTVGGGHLDQPAYRRIALIL